MTVGFSDRFRHAAWTPVSIRTSHPSGFRGVLELAVPRTDLFSQAQSYARFIQEVDLAAGEARTHWFTVPMRASPYPLVVTVKDEAGSVAVTLEKELRGQAVEGPFFLVLDPAASGWTFLSGELQAQAGRTATPTVVHARSAAEIPGDALALSALTAIIVRDSFSLSSLSPAQLDAIAAYVRSGGHLILAGGPSPPRLPLAWLSWLPQITGRVVNLEVEGASLPAWELDPGSERETAGFRGALSLSRAAGAGLASVVAYDPSSPALSGDTGAALRLEATAVAHMRPALSGGVSMADDDVWQLVNQIEVAFGNSQWLTVVAIAYALIVCGVAFATMHRPRLHYSLLAFVVATSAAYAYHYTRETGIRAQAGFAEVQLTRGLIPGVAHNRSYLLAVSTALFPQDLEVSGPRPLPFPALFRDDGDVTVYVKPYGSLFQGVPARAPLRIFHDSFEEIDILVRARADESEPLVIVNNSDYELRHVHYIERQRLASLGHIPPHTTVEWTSPQERVASAGWMGMTLQAGLLRQPADQRPDDIEIRLLALAADRGLGESLISAESDRPFIVALIEPKPVLTPRPGGPRVTKRVLIFPAFWELPLISPDR